MLIVTYSTTEKRYNIATIGDVNSLVDFCKKYSPDMQNITVHDEKIESIATLGSLIGGYIIKGIGESAVKECVETVNLYLKETQSASCFLSSKSITAKSLHVIDSNETHHEFTFPFSYSDMHKALTKKEGEETN